MADLVSLREASIEFGVAQVTLRRYINARRLTAFRRGMDRRIYLDRGELAAVRTARPAEAPTSSADS